MVNFENFEEFATAAWHLFCKRPLFTRYEIKYRHADRVVVLKVTDDIQCIKFKCTEQSSWRPVETLQALFLRWTVSPTESLDPSLKFDAMIGEIGEALHHVEPQEGQGGSGAKKKKKNRRG
mmetsp:Transcript_38570/g.75735  ORF Transcript_38570/g.75735 Transcript_38570/m.75735 type:complete len:121 (+) Transcript_38570:360-722(+)